MEPLKLVSSAKEHQAAAELCNRYLQSMVQLSEAQAHTLNQYVLNTACDPDRAACGDSEFDSLEIAWWVGALHSSAEPEETTPFTKELIYPDRFARTYASGQELAQSEKHAALEFLKTDDKKTAHRLAQFFVWQRYLFSFLNLNQDIPCSPVVDASEPAIDTLRTRLRTELKNPSHGDAMTAIARELIRGAFGSVGCDNRFRRRFPKKRNGMALSDVLESDIESPEEKVFLNRQVALHPSREGDWEKMIPRVQENWLLSMFIHRFNQDMPMTKHPLSFRDNYLLHWIDIGTRAGDIRWKKRTTLGHQRTRPIIVNLGDNAWCIFDRQTKETLCRTSDVVRVLVAWMYLVHTRYNERLENGVLSPRFELHFAAVGDAAPMDLVE